MFDRFVQYYTTHSVTHSEDCDMGFAVAKSEQWRLLWAYRTCISVFVFLVVALFANSGFDSNELIFASFITGAKRITYGNLISYF